MVHCAAIFRSIIRPPLSFECLKITCLMRAVSGPYLGFRVTALTVHSPIVLALKGYWRFPRSTSHSADTETEAQKVAVFAQSPTAIIIYRAPRGDGSWGQGDWGQWAAGTASLRKGCFSRALKDCRIWESHVGEAGREHGRFGVRCPGGEWRGGAGERTAEALQSLLGQGWISSL